MAGGRPATAATVALAVACLVCSACLAAAPGRAATLTGFLSTPTEQLGVPGLAASAEITPEGDLYTGWAEYEWRLGSGLKDWDQPTRTAPDPSLPLFQSRLTEGGVTYTQSDFAVAVAGEPVAYVTFTVANTSGRARRARLGMAIAYTRGRQIKGAHGLSTGAYRYERPVSGGKEGYYEQPGQAFSPAFAYSSRGRDLDRSGLLLARGPALRGRPLAGTGSSPLTATHDGRAFTILLAGHARRSLTWQIPLEPPAAGRRADARLDAVAPARARALLDGLWAREEAGMTSIEVPEQRVQAAYRAAIVQILDSRIQTPSGWVQAVNRLQYQAFWIRDAAMETQALDLAGLRGQARQDLSFMDAFQQPDGLFISRAGQYDGLGQALWALDRHAELAGEGGFAAAQLQRVGAAVRWLATASGEDPLGLLPVGEPGDDELIAGHITGDDLWAAAGLLAAVDLAERAGRPDLASDWRAIEARFETSLRSAIAGALARVGHIPPALDAAGGQDWGNYYAAYPEEVLPAGSAAVTATLAWARAHSAQGLATYMNGTSLHDYLGFPIFQTELERGEAPRALAGLYSELAHTTASYGGWEWGVAPGGPRGSAVDMSPHGTFSADYVALLRDLLVREGPGGEVELMAGASPAWLRAGQRVSVADAPTAGGGVSFSERSTAGGETLSWHSRLSAGARLVWRLPWWARRARTAAGRSIAGGTVALHGASGSLTVRFEGRPPAISYAREVAALDAEYRAHGRRAPLVAPVR